MAVCKLGLICLILSLFNNAVSQNPNLDSLYQTTNSLNTFAINFLAETIEAAGDDLNLALSPYTIWSLLSILAEGADGNTAVELNRALHLPANKDLFRRSYRFLKNNLTERSDGVTLDISNAIFTPNDQIIKKNFQEVTKSLYGVDILPMDIYNIPSAVKTINSYMATATRNRIPNFVSENDLSFVEIFLTSAMFFKGRWTTPFNKTSTFKDIFLDARGNPKGQVNMMYLSAPFPFVAISELRSLAIELPYGTGDKMSMVAILPRKNENLSNVMRLLSSYTITKVLETLENAVAEYPEADVQVFLPKFKIESDLNLNAILDRLGVKDLFNSVQANLLNLSTNYLFVSRILQKAFIEVDEEGTVATAASGAVLEDKTPPPQFRANRPFAFFIIEKKTKSIVFAGKVSNPNGI